MEEAAAFCFVKDTLDQRRKWQRDAEMVKNAEPRPLETLQYVHECMACLVEGVYARDRQAPDYKRYWEGIGYAEMDINEIGDPDSREKISNRSVPLRVMVFKRLGSGGREYILKKDEVMEPVRVQAPKYVVAIRGTLTNWSGELSNWRGWSDICADLHILSQTICIINSYNEPVKKVIKDLHDKCSGEGDVCVAGHSLGAMLAEGAARLLATDEHIVLQAHLFNLPNVSLRTLASEFTLRSLRGFSNLISRVPLFGKLAGAFVRGSGKLLVSAGDGAMTGMAGIVFPSALARADKSNDLLIERRFCPHIYVNPNDVVCNDYIRHFKMKYEDRPTISNTTGVLESFYKERACGCYRIRRAYLHTNNWGEGEFEAHKLHQWYLYAPVEFKSKLV